MLGELLESVAEGGVEREFVGPKIQKRRSRFFSLAAV
jgi:hypothetical protein